MLWLTETDTQAQYASSHSEKKNRRSAWKIAKTNTTESYFSARLSRRDSDLSASDPKT